MTPITNADLTTGAVTGTGVFDILMAANKAHIEAEFNKGRITAADYSTVYLGVVQATLNTAVSFLLQRDKVSLEADLVQKQIELVQAQIEQAEKQTVLINAQAALATAQKEKVDAEILNVPKEGELIDAQVCKLKAEFDLTMTTITKVGKESELLAQKVVTEKSQTLELGVDQNSLIGKQKALYQAQTEGFTRDAEQKGTKILIDTWNARRMTDDGTVADGVNMLNDATIGRFVNKLAAGIGA